MSDAHLAFPTSPLRVVLHALDIRFPSRPQLVTRL